MKFFSIILILISGMLLHIVPAQSLSMKNTDQNIKTAKNLFQWNTQNLISSAHLKQSEIANFFAPDFVVDANGIKNQANYDNYFQFLNKFRENIKTIDYKFEDFIIDKDHVVTPLKAYIQFNDESKKTFDAILILKFNKEHKIILWHEVYVEISG